MNTQSYHTAGTAEQITDRLVSLGHLHAECGGGGGKALESKAGSAGTLTARRDTPPCPSLSSKQRLAIVNRNIRDMIASGCILGLRSQDPLSHSGEYVYSVSPTFRHRDHATCAVLCLAQGSMKPLRAFAR